MIIDPWPLAIDLQPSHELFFRFISFGGTNERKNPFIGVWLPCWPLKLISGVRVSNSRLSNFYIHTFAPTGLRMSMHHKDGLHLGLNSFALSGLVKSHISDYKIAFCTAVILVKNALNWPELLFNPSLLYWLLDSDSWLLILWPWLRSLGPNQRMQRPGQ